MLTWLGLVLTLSLVAGAWWLRRAGREFAFASKAKTKLLLNAQMLSDASDDERKRLLGEAYQELPKLSFFERNEKRAVLTRDALKMQPFKLDARYPQLIAFETVNADKIPLDEIKMVFSERQLVRRPSRDELIVQDLMPVGRIKGIVYSAKGISISIYPLLRTFNEHSLFYYYAHCSQFFADVPKASTYRCVHCESLLSEDALSPTCPWLHGRLVLPEYSEEILRSFKIEKHIALELSEHVPKTFDCLCCGATMRRLTLKGDEVDLCRSCGALWLDEGELSKELPNESLADV